MAKESNMLGGYFSPAGFFRVETGGSHDENPNGGVQIGVDEQGIPNMLEEGEPVYDDYVFSDNITADESILKQFHIPSKYAGKLYSEIADAIVDEAEERPLDTVSNNGLRVMLGRLSEAQEQQKQEQQEKELEEELANLSPEELAELEAMLAEQGITQQQAQGQEIAEQNAIPAEQGIPVEQQIPVMATGGPFRRRVRGYMRDTLYDLQHGKSMTKSERDKLKAEELQSDINSLFRIPTLREIKGFLRGEPFGQKKYELDPLIAIPGITDQNIKLEKGPAYIGVDDGAKLELYANGGLIRRFDEGTPGKVTNSGGAGHSGGGTGGGTREIEIRFPSILELVLGSDNKIVQANKRFQDWLDNSTVGRVIDAVVPDSATGAFVPAIKPAAGVSKIMDEAYRALEAEKASESAYRGAKVAGEAASAARNSGIGKKIWNVAKYFVDPSAVWRNGWKPTGFWGKAAKGTVGALHSGAVGTAEASAAGKAIGKGINIYNNSKSEEFDVDPFAHRKFDIGGKVVRQFSDGTGKVVVVPNTYTGGTWNWFDRYFAEPVKFNYGLNLSGASGYSNSPAETKKIGVLPKVGLIESNDALLKKGLVDTRKFKKTKIGYYEDGNYVTEPTIVSPEKMRENMKSKYGDKTGDDTTDIQPTWSRYTGPIGHSLLALSNLVTPPTKFTYKRAHPYYPTGNLVLQDMEYNPIPIGIMMNPVLSSSAGNVRALNNSGLGPSTASAIVAADRALGQSIGDTLLAGWKANNDQRSNVLQFNNSLRKQAADYAYQMDLARANALERAQQQNIQNDLMVQRLNDAAESEKYTAIGNELGHAMDALSGIGTENFNMNMVNSVYPYVIDKNGRVRYIMPSAFGGLLKTYKK